MAATVSCRDSAEGGAGPSRQNLPDPSTEDDSDQVIRLSYLCGNRFLITSASAVPVTVSWQVGGSEEEGEVALPGAPEEEPGISEEVIETRNRGPVQISVAGQPVRTRANEAIPCTPSTTAPTAHLTTASASTGEWSAVFPWPHVAVHLVLLPNGRVLSWGLKPPVVWNPETGQFTTVAAPIKIFCSGQTLLSDGKVFTAGGHIQTDRGLKDITVFDPTANTWIRHTPMPKGRWYPTVTTMANGDVVITAGSDSNKTTVLLPEVWSNGVLRVLTGASRNVPYYPRAFLAPNGKLFYAGQQQTTRYLDVSGAGVWTTVASRLWATRDYGSAAMYDQGKVIYAGGGRTTNTAEVIDLNVAKPKWRWTSSMAFARRHFNLTILPTGELVATSGLAGTVFNDMTQPVFAAEIWNPVTEVWTTMASAQIPRGYHANALLIPDGRVLVSGSGEGSTAPQEKNAELFSPPYLFNGPRPTISAAPQQVSYGGTFSVETPDAASIAMVSLIRLGAATHSFNMNQRFQKLGFTVDATGLTVGSPTNPNITPPGHYMLFLVNASSVPSVAAIIQVI